jgi:Txe/YoeB family toxin of Txe-Axe toxin-antitoxin module
VKNFQDFFNRPVLGVNELIDIQGIGKVKAKVDSGNEGYNVLHGIDIKTSNGKITFTTVDNKTVTLPLNGDMQIHIGSGVKEDRPMVKLSFSLLGKTFTEPFTIADRSENEDPVLIGEPFLKKIRGLVDVSKEINESLQYKVIAKRNDELSKAWNKKKYTEKEIRKIANRQKVLITDIKGSPKFKGKNKLKIVNPLNKKSFIKFKKVINSDTTETD